MSKDAPKPFASLFGNTEDKPAFKEPPKFQGLFQSIDPKADAEEGAGAGGFKNFSMPSFGSGSFGSSGFGSGKISFAAAGSTLLSDSKSGAFTSMFGSCGGDRKEEDKEKASFDAAAAAAPAADLAKALQEKAQEEKKDVDDVVQTPKAAVSELPEVDQKTGEEGEQRLFAANDVKLYMFKKGAENRWKECGRGALHVNRNTESGCCRIIMRRANTHQLVLNARLWADMLCDQLGEKEVRISCADEDGAIQMYSVRVLQGSGCAKELAKVIDENKKSIAESEV